MQKLTSIFDDLEQSRMSQLKTNSSTLCGRCLAPAVAGGAPGTPREGLCKIPAPLQKKVLRNLKILILLFWGFALVFLSLFWASSLTLFFEEHVLLILEPLGVDFELPS